MDVQLWRWSTAVQITSALLIALFFVVLARSTRRAELRVWVAAWGANLGALIATLVYWMPPAQSESLLFTARFPYLFFKTSFVVLLVVGAVSFGRPQPSRTTLWRLATVVLLGSVVTGLGVQSLDTLGAGFALSGAGFARRASSAKKVGTNKVAMKVAASMPPKTPVPID